MQHFNIPRATPRGRGPIGNGMLLTVKHTQRVQWWRVHRYAKRPFGITKHYHMPRILLSRDIYKGKWSPARNFPEPNKWEKIVNGQRVNENRWSLVEEGGAMYKVNWELYSQRLQSELKSAFENTPQYTFQMKSAPIHWKTMDIQMTPYKGMSVREALAQGKLSARKGPQILYRCLESAAQGAENKGLDREKLRISFARCYPGPTDAQIDIRSKGFYSWKTKKSTHVVVTVVEDPDLVLPDRSSLPYSSLISLRKAGLYQDAVVLDVPAITADGI